MGALCLARRFGHGSRKLPKCPAQSMNPTTWTRPKLPQIERSRDSRDPVNRALALPTKYWHGSRGPYIELLMRWWLAKVFFLRGLTGVMIVHWALEVARYEYHNLSHSVLPSIQDPSQRDDLRQSALVSWGIEL